MEFIRWVFKVGSLEYFQGWGVIVVWWFLVSRYLVVFQIQGLGFLVVSSWGGGGRGLSFREGRRMFFSEGGGSFCILWFVLFNCFQNRRFIQMDYIRFFLFCSLFIVFLKRINFFSFGRGGSVGGNLLFTWGWRRWVDLFCKRYNGCFFQ